MTLTMTHKGPAISEPQLLSFETHSNLELPSSYRTFLSDVNGCRLEANYCKLPTAARIGAGARAFFGVNRGDALDFADAKSRWADRLPDGFLAIAEAEGGNLICLCTARRDFGAVYVWDHESQPEEGEPPVLESLHRIASDFAEYYVALAPMSDMTLPKETGNVENAWIDPDLLAQWKK